MEDGPGAKRGIADGLRRLLDQRDEQRSDGVSQSAALTHGGGRHVVGIVNLSSSGAMIRYRGNLVEGEEVTLHLLDHGAVTGQVRWIRDGRLGISFTAPVDSVQDER